MRATLLPSHLSESPLGSSDADESRDAPRPEKPSRQPKSGGRNGDGRGGRGHGGLRPIDPRTTPRHAIVPQRRADRDRLNPHRPNSHLSGLVALADRAGRLCDAARGEVRVELSRAAAHREGGAANRLRSVAARPYLPGAVNFLALDRLPLNRAAPRSIDHVWVFRAQRARRLSVSVSARAASLFSRAASLLWFGSNQARLSPCAARCRAPRTSAPTPSRPSRRPRPRRGHGSSPTRASRAARSSPAPKRKHAPPPPVPATIVTTKRAP